MLGRKDKNEPGLLTGIAQALDEISWHWLGDNFPRLAEEIGAAVQSGAEPGQVRRFVMRQTQRTELALRCEQAARWLEETA